MPIALRTFASTSTRASQKAIASMAGTGLPRDARASATLRPMPIGKLVGAALERGGVLAAGSCTPE